MRRRPSPKLKKQLAARGRNARRKSGLRQACAEAKDKAACDKGLRQGLCRSQGTRPLGTKAAPRPVPKPRTRPLVTSCTKGLCRSKDKAACEKLSPRPVPKPRTRPLATRPVPKPRPLCDKKAPNKARLFPSRLLIEPGCYKVVASLLFHQNLAQQLEFLSPPEAECPALVFL